MTSVASRPGKRARSPEVATSGAPLISRGERTARQPAYLRPWLALVLVHVRVSGTLDAVASPLAWWLSAGRRLVRIRGRSAAQSAQHQTRLKCRVCAAAGMNKMVINHLDKLLVTSDAATIVKELEVAHPAARLVVLAAQAQEAEIGDGTNLVRICCVCAPAAPGPEGNRAIAGDFAGW